MATKKKKSRSLNTSDVPPKNTAATKSGGKAPKAQGEGSGQKQAIANTTKTQMKRQKKKPSRVRDHG
jgi:hypothetical protein